MTLKRKQYLKTLFLSFFLGQLGLHRFYHKKVGTGICMLTTIGGLGLWWLTDLIVVASGKFKDHRGRVIRF